MRRAVFRYTQVETVFIAGKALRVFQVSSLKSDFDPLDNQSVFFSVHSLLQFFKRATRLDLDFLRNDGFSTVNLSDHIMNGQATMFDFFPL